ncbi:MAG: hypothetical protein SFY92_12625 [Verrucomicrobiae bacterium]|nr:hypothetical protein [Verrucomicrobiae bacterium]
MSDEQIHISVNGETQGPFPIFEVINRCQKGEIDAVQSWAWDGAAWVPLQGVIDAKLAELKVAPAEAVITSDFSDDNPDVEDALKKIRTGYIFGYVVAAFSMIGGVIFLFVKMEEIQISPIGLLISAGLVAGLSTGVLFKSRVCAGLLLAYYVVDKIIMMVMTGQPGGLIMMAIFAYGLFLGLVGTINYHLIKAGKKPFRMSGG